VGAAIALWPRRYAAGLALGLTLVKPQLVLPLAVAVVVWRQWKVLVGWAAAGVVLILPTLAVNPRWIGEWLGQTRATVAPISREVDIPHFGALLPGSTFAVAVLAVVTVGAVVYLAWRARGQHLRPAVSILIVGGVLAAPHALPADLVLVALGLAVWGEARWIEWVALSVGALVAALAPAPVPAVVGVVLLGWLLSRISLSRSPAPAPASLR
jgi:hypothetical protein